MRRTYGPLFFDVVTVDAWYATEPFFKAVHKLGWPVVAVLKQELWRQIDHALERVLELEPLWSG